MHGAAEFQIAAQAHRQAVQAALFTVNIIDGGKIIEKKQMKLPERVTNVVKCKNPRCITSVEQELDQVFCLTNPEKAQYRCLYCEQEYARK